jgi:hypothetical protein
LVHTRFGSYYEPKRFTNVVAPDNPQANTTVGRQHFTFGADLRLFETRWFGLVPPVIYQLQTSIDIAPRYQSASLGIGVWHSGVSSSATRSRRATLSSALFQGDRPARARGRSP